MADTASTTSTALEYSIFQKSDYDHRLLGTLRDNTDRVNAAIIIPDKKAIASVSDDKNIRVWVNVGDLQNKLFLSKEMPSACTSMFYIKECSSLYIAQENGTITEFTLSEDCKELTFVREYLAHDGRITKIIYSPEHNWIVSCGKDCRMAYHCSKTLKMVGEFKFDCECTALDFNAEKKNAFVGEFSGEVTMVRCNSDGALFEKLFLRSLVIASSTINYLKYDLGRDLLYSACFEKCIIVWDASLEDYPLCETKFKMEGHRYEVTGLYHIIRADILISCGGDGGVVFWDLNFKRDKAPLSIIGTHCYLCNRKYKYTFHGIGLREVNCKHCGQSICVDCATNKTYNPKIGYELDVICCDACFKKLKDTERPTGRYEFSTKSPIVTMDFDEENKRLITVGKDNCIRIWDLTRLLKY